MKFNFLWKKEKEDLKNLNDFQTALYYPYIDLTDTGFVKTAALYWDQLQTIVPEPVLYPYESPISKEATDAGFLKPRIVNSRDKSVKKTGDEFCADIEQENIKQRIITCIHKVKRKRFSRIHFEKWAPDSLFKVWRAIKNDIPLSPDVDDYVIFPEPLGNAYMSRLASVIAQHDKTTPLTNLPDYQDILTDRFVDYSEEQKQVQLQLATMSLQTISIEPETPLIEILRFKDKYKHRKMLFDFRRYIRDLTRQVSAGLQNSKKQEIFIELIKDKILPAGEEIGKKLDENNLRFVAGNIVLTLAGCAGAAISQEWLGYLVVTGILAGAKLIGNLREERLILEEHPLCYLYQVQKKFGVNK